MPARLEHDYVVVSWRVNKADYKLLQAVHGRKMQAVVREVITAYCARLRQDAVDGGLYGQPEP